MYRTKEWRGSMERREDILLFPPRCGHSVGNLVQCIVFVFLCLTVVFLCLAADGFELLFSRTEVLTWRRGEVSVVDVRRVRGSWSWLIMIQCVLLQCTLFVFLSYASVCLYSSTDSGHSTPRGSFDIFYYKSVKT